MPTSKKNSLLNSKIFWIVFSIVASLLLWGYVIAVEGEEGELTYYGIDVKFNGEETLRASRGFVITDVSSNSVNVTLRGRRSVLSSFGADDLSAVIDVSNVSRTGMAEKSATINFPSNVDQSSIQVVSRTPNTISYYVDSEITQTKELRGVFEGSVAEGYTRDEFIFDPATVRISGPAAAVDQVRYARVTVTRDDLDRTVSYETTYELVDAEGNIVENATIELETETVNVTLPIKATKSVPLTVDIISGGGATEKNVVITCVPETVTLAGDAETLSGLNRISVDTVNLSSFDPSMTKTCTIIFPNNVENLSGETEVEVTVEIKGLATARRNVTNLDYANLPEGFTAEIVSRSLDVVIRGEESDVQEVAANNIRVVADLSDITTAGTAAVPARVYVDGFANVGAVGEYRMYVTIDRE